jgi:hypothetical protein
MSCEAKRHLSDAAWFVGSLCEHGDLRQRIDRTRAALSAAAAVLNDDQRPEHQALELMNKTSDNLKRLEMLVNTIELDLCEALTEIRQSRALDSEIWEP